MTLTAHCHCGSTSVEFPEPTEARRCNCTFCSRLGAVWAYYPPEQVEVRATHDAVYSASGMNEHHFCGRCGNHTHGLSPDWASVYNADGTPKGGDPSVMPDKKVMQVNLLLVDDLDMSRLQIEELDGRHSW